MSQILSHVAWESNIQSATVLGARLHRSQIQREKLSLFVLVRIKFIPFTETTAIGLFLWCSPLCFNFLSCVTQRDKERCSSKACCCGELNSKISSIGGRFALNWGQREFRSRSIHVLLRPLVVKRRVLSAFIRAGFSWVYI